MLYVVCVIVLYTCCLIISIINTFFYLFIFVSSYPSPIFVDLIDMSYEVKSYLHIHICICICIYIYVCVCVYVCMCMYKERGYLL